MGCGGCVSKLRGKKGLEEPLIADVRDPNKYAPRSSSNSVSSFSSGSQSNDIPPGELQADLLSVVQAAGLSWPLPSDKFDEILAILGKLPPRSASSWLRDWTAKASTKSRAGLRRLLEHVVSRSLLQKIEVAEELVASDGGEATETSEFGRLSEVCKDVLTLQNRERNCVSTSMTVMSSSSSSSPPPNQDNKSEAMTSVAVLDRLILLFRPSLLAHISDSAKNSQLWKDFEVHIGIPHLGNSLDLLSCGAKAVLLNVLLVSDAIPATNIIVSRDRALSDAAKELPAEQACVLSPYFESSSGTKVVQGRRVEGGEGHGPRKEFFIATTSDALRKWSASFVPPFSGPPPAPVKVSFQGNRIRFEQISSSGNVADESGRSALLQQTLEAACIGDRLRLEFSNGVEVEFPITAKLGTAGATVGGQFDSSICNASLFVRHCGLQKALKPLFEFHRGSGQHWFSAYASELEHPRHGTDLRSKYFTFGKLLLLALANRCKIAFALPIPFFKLLLDATVQCSLEDLKGFDDDLHSSLKRCLKMKLSDFKALKDVEGLPKEMSREDYVADKVKETFMPQGMQEIRKGFWSLTRQEVFKHVSASDLRQILCPIDHLGQDIDIRSIFKVIMEDEMEECDLFANAFWSVVNGFSLEEKKLFLRFVTGNEAPPEPGTERLLIELPFSAFSKDEHRAMLDMLPQAHTCSNTLELPNYHDALLESGKVREDQGGGSGSMLDVELQRVLGEKLRMAVRETAGYELDAVVEVADGWTAPPMVGPPIRHLSPELEVCEDKRNAWGLGGEGTVRDSGGSLTRVETPSSGGNRMSPLNLGNLGGSMPSAGDVNSDEVCNVLSRQSSGHSSESLQSLRLDPVTNVRLPPISSPTKHQATSSSFEPKAEWPSPPMEAVRRQILPESLQPIRPFAEVFSPPGHPLQPLQPLRPFGQPPMEAHGNLDVLEPLDHPLGPLKRFSSRDIGGRDIGGLEPLRPPAPLSTDPPVPAPGSRLPPLRPQGSAMRHRDHAALFPPDLASSSSSDGDGVFDQNDQEEYLSLLNSRPGNDPYRHAPQSAPVKMETDIDNLIEELDML